MSVSLINGHIDPEVSISTQIANLLEERYMLDHEDCTWECQVDIYDYAGRVEEHYVNTDIEQIMKKNGIKNFFIEIIDIYDNPGIDCRCLCVSWIENGRLEGFNQPLYRY